MMHWTKLCLCAMVLLVFTIGCKGPEMTEEMMKDMAQKRKVRGPEFDVLDRLVGTWEGKATMEMEGTEKTSTWTSVSTNMWDEEHRYLIEHSEMEMGDMGKSHGVGLWTWSPDKKKYVSWWFDGMGMVYEGEAEYDLKTDCFTMDMKGRDLYEGHTWSGDGKMCFVDDDNTTFEIEEYALWGLIEIMEMEGTSTRR